MKGSTQISRPIAFNAKSALDAIRRSGPCLFNESMVMVMYFGDNVINFTAIHKGHPVEDSTSSIEGKCSMRQSPVYMTHYQRGKFIKFLRMAGREEVSANIPLDTDKCDIVQLCYTIARSPVPKTDAVFSFVNTIEPQEKHPILW